MYVQYVGIVRLSIQSIFCMHPNDISIVAHTVMKTDYPLDI